MNRKVRILYIIDKLVCAGAQRQLIELLRNIDRSRYDPAVCCLLYEGEWGGKVREMGIPIHVLGLKRVYGFRAVRRLVSLVRFLRRQRHDIVQNFLFAANVFGTFAAKLAGVKVIINSRRQAGYWRENSGKLIWRWINRNSQYVIANSRSVKTFLVEREGIDPDKVLVINNGIPITPLSAGNGTLRKELSLDGDAIIIAIVGNLIAVKGHKDLLDAFELVAKSCERTHLVCVGDGELRHELEETVRKKGLQSRVHFLGHREDISEILQDVDIGALASLSEGMPNAVLEYMRAGKATITTAVGGVPDLIQDGVNGMLVRLGGTRAMAEALVILCEWKEMREKLGAAAREDVENYFSSRKMVRSYEIAYERMLQQFVTYDDARMVKIAYVVSQFPCYDETFVAREFKALADLGTDFAIFSLKPCRDEVIHNDAESLLHRTVYLPFISFRNTLNMLYSMAAHPFRMMKSISQVIIPTVGRPSYMLKLLAVMPKLCSYARMISQKGFEHIHAHWATVPTECAMILSRLTNIPFSFTGHAHDIFLENPALRRKLEEAQFVLTCTDDNKRHLLQMFPSIDGSKIVVSHHGVDLEEYLLKPPAHRGQEGAFQILSVGSLFECKGFEYLIRACGKLSARGVDYRCRIIGGGYLHNELSELIDELELRDRVELLGYMRQEKLVNYYAGADLFILPAVLKMHWGIPNVVLESLAVGTPVACTPLPALKELSDGRQCIYTIPEKDPDAIADLVEKCAADGAELASLGRAGRAIIEKNFDIRKNAETVREVLHDAIV